jgi:hypothetical protein
MAKQTLWKELASGDGPRNMPTMPIKKMSKTKMAKVKMSMKPLKNCK